MVVLVRMCDLVVAMRMSVLLMRVLWEPSPGDEDADDEDRRGSADGSV